LQVIVRCYGQAEAIGETAEFLRTCALLLLTAVVSGRAIGGAGKGEKEEEGEEEGFQNSSMFNVQCSKVPKFKVPGFQGSKVPLKNLNKVLNLVKVLPC